MKQTELSRVWTALGHRLAVVTGAGTALLSLIWHSPASDACLRGAVAWAAIRVLARTTQWLTARTEPETDQKPDTDSAEYQGGEPG
ncbi:MAG: hypothetical protein E2O39_13605 [Planctomycetota bacterium]|nr:MAG: hypothetical protein E2O39_13605 [Planctomycetota bacterium]